MPRCSKCRLIKPQDAFYKHSAQRYRSDCKECFKQLMRPRSKKHYQCNKRYYRDRNKKASEAVRQYIWATKTGAVCEECKLPHPPWRMDFDHVRGTKKGNLSVAAARGWTLKQVKEEIAKCDLVCTNCHRDRTYARRSVK